MIYVARVTVLNAQERASLFSCCDAAETGLRVVI